MKEILAQAGISKEALVSEESQSGGVVEVELYNRSDFNKIVNETQKALFFQEGETRVYVAVTGLPPTNKTVWDSLLEHQILVKFDREFSSSSVQTAYERFCSVLSGEPVIDFIQHPKIVNYFIVTMALKRDVQYILREKNRKKAGEVTVYLSGVESPFPLTQVFALRDTVASRVAAASSEGIIKQTKNKNKKFKK